MIETDVYIIVGSNIRPEKNIAAALERLNERAAIAAVSTFYRTRPLDGGAPGQPGFLNGVVRVKTAVPPRPFKFEVLRVIEAELGRARGLDRYADRTIDLDIALYGDRVISEADLKIPDPDVRVRPFVAVPLLELAPELILPDTGEALAVLDVVRAAAELAPDRAFTAWLQARIVS